MPNIIRRQRRRRQPGSLLATGAGTLVGAVVGAAGGWILFSNTRIDHELPLEKALPAEREIYFSEAAGRLSYYFDRRAAGRPLVLLHSINAAASAFEMGPLFEHYRASRPVYALDLPGYTSFLQKSEHLCMYGTILLPRLQNHASLCVCI
jgi:hypothetical protein